MKPVALLALFLLLSAAVMFAADLTVPQQAVAGTEVTIGTSGGEGTLYVIGPTLRMKRKVRGGEPVSLGAQEVRMAGRYVAILHADGGTVSKAFFVRAADVENMNFLAQPSRVPTGAHDVISGTAFVSDRWHNLVLTPTPVKFELTVQDATPLARTVTARDGLAWTRLDSMRRAGNAQFTASAGDVQVNRVIQQTAAEPCNLRIHAQRSSNGVVVETDPVRDCSGNPVPDGTIVTFTALDARGKSTVDARIKRGIARAELPAGPSTISVASGVVVGNEIRWGGGQ